MQHKLRDGDEAVRVSTSGSLLWKSAENDELQKSGDAAALEAAPAQMPSCTRVPATPGTVTSSTLVRAKRRLSEG